ncbi:NfeD family protein [Arhodomonas sp. AD133]|uniref:NfeD family protein n=1 Tax=Arhodomonas sp. AD133 TaxID=3415009 RepID=UPI003EBFC4AA
MDVRFIQIIALACGLMLSLAAGTASGATVWQLDIKGPIGPVTATYVRDGIEAADREGVAAVILRVDTPGGLDNAMRTIVRAVLAARTPVVVWVAPSGARAASAGTYILYASHVAAMAPATNLGAATPVQIGGGGFPGPGGGDGGGDGDGEADGKGEDQPASNEEAMRRKVVNDAVAYIRGLAELRGRDAEWAEQAVRGGESLSAQAALERGVVEIVAADAQELLSALHGREVETASGERTLDTENAQVVSRAPDWRTRLLSVIAHPNVAYILMLVGIYGLIFELANPGAIVPGVIGGIALLLALFALQVLPVNYAGIGLILFGVALMLAEAFAPSFGILGLGGMVAFVVGSLLLFDTDVPGFQLSILLVAGVSLASVALLFGAGTMAARAYRRPVVSGRQQLIGASASVVSGFPGHGRVRVRGELWQAESSDALAPQEVVEVVDMRGLRLVVARLDRSNDRRNQV